MRIPKFLLTAIILFNLSQSLFAQWQSAPSGYGYYIDAPVAAGNGNASFTQLWHDNAVIWKYGNGSVGGLRFGSATDLNAANWTERMKITDNGFVGIGTSTPRGKLDIWGGVLHVTGLDFNGTHVAGAQAGNAWIGCNTLTNGISISPAGQIGVGTSSQHALVSLGSGGGKRFLVYDDPDVNGSQLGFGINMSGNIDELSIFHSTKNGNDGDISFGKRQNGTGNYT